MRERKVFSLLLFFFYNIIVAATISNQRKMLNAFSAFSVSFSLLLVLLRSLLFSMCDCLAAMTVDDE